MSPTTAVAPQIEIRAEERPEWEEILTEEALQFAATLHREFNPRRKELLSRRERVKQELDSGKSPDFLSETQSIRDSEWTVARIPMDLIDRRVEITVR